MSILAAIMRIVTTVMTHEVYGPVARRLAREATAAVVRSVRTATRKRSVTRVS